VWATVLDELLTARSSPPRETADSGLEVIGLEPGSLGDTGEHARSDFFVVMESKYEIGPTYTL
jgi:hypothetical protein